MNASVASPHDAMGKVPQVTLLFWLIKIAATTLGETGGDAVSMSWLGETTPGATGYGYLVGTAIFAAIFALAVWAQIRATRFHPFLYWTTIIASTTVGTTLADYVTRSLGVGYAGGSTLLLALVLGSLWWWKHVLGTVSVDSVADPTSEAFYWLTIMCSQTLGTALGDWTADSLGLGYAGGALVFGALLLALWLLYRWTTVSRIALFWAAFVLTRPLGAVLGDLLDKPIDHGGLALSRYAASLALLAAMAGMVLLVRQHPARSIAHG